MVASFLAWYFTWFGRGLSDADITTYLVDVNHPRHVQHALLQIQQRIERGDKGARQWYPQILALVDNKETEFRLTVAWLMGADNTEEQFHQALRKLVVDPEPIVRRNAALALVRFNDAGGRRELLATLEPFNVTAPTGGVLQSSLTSGAHISRGTLLARIEETGKRVVELRSPLLGAVDRLLVANGANVAPGDAVLTIKSDEQSIWEALRGLAVVGGIEELAAVDRYRSGADVSDRIKQQAALTSNAIESRVQE